MGAEDLAEQAVAFAVCNFDIWHMAATGVTPAGNLPPSGGGAGLARQELDEISKLKMPSPVATNIFYRECGNSGNRKHIEPSRTLAVHNCELISKG